MIRYLLAAWWLTLSALVPALAQDQTDLQRLYQALRVPETVEILRDEGLAYAMESDTALLGQSGGTDWAEAVARIYDTNAMEQIVRAGFDKALGATDVSLLLAYFESPVGQRVIGLEVSARRAFVSPGVEEAARASWRENPLAGAHTDAITQFIKVNQLIDRNVTGALNANYLFLRALSQADQSLTEEQILSDVWAEEALIRDDTREWMHAFLTMAYTPLSVEEMATYLALWKNAEGQALNHALFVSFDRMFEVVSEALGTAAAQQQGARDL